ncbi:hypothetical protein TcG_05365 [Trypanosoma cruzi]|nr:hypothetical protein TcG_05365 [Trypanosoma cruzi]
MSSGFNSKSNTSAFFTIQFLGTCFGGGADGVLNFPTQCHLRGSPAVIAGDGLQAGDPRHGCPALAAKMPSRKYSSPFNRHAASLGCSAGGAQSPLTMRDTLQCFGDSFFFFVCVCA